MNYRIILVVLYFYNVNFIYKNMLTSNKFFRNIDQNLRYNVVKE
jgi:hypothetical protein